MNQQVNPDDPDFRAAVVDILDQRMAELDHPDANIVTRIRTQLYNAGYTDAAEFVHRNFGS